MFSVGMPHTGPAVLERNYSLDEVHSTMDDKSAIETDVIQYTSIYIVCML